jgi:spore maturation protein CgeB
MRVTILGLSITSSWGNGHATNYRGLARALHHRGDQVTFLERERSWYAQHRDLLEPPWCRTILYESVAELQSRLEGTVRDADLVIVGSFVPDGVDVAKWVLTEATGPVAFYDIDTPVTLEKLRCCDHEYLTAELVSQFDLSLSYTAGPALDCLEREFGARRRRAFYFFVDPNAYRPVDVPQRFELNYLGTYSRGRQPALEQLLLEPARRRGKARFAVAGPMYPPEIQWPANLERIDHLAPGEHPCFYGSAAFTLNVTRPEMRALGYAPSVRLFEAAACGVPIISDIWPGIETILEPGREIFLADGADDVLAILDRTDRRTRVAVATSARRRVLCDHTAERRAAQLHELALEVGAEVLRT